MVGEIPGAVSRNLWQVFPSLPLTLDMRSMHISLEVAFCI